MVIRKGVDWGMPGSLPTDAPVVSSNAELRHVVRDGARTVGVTGGDLCRTLGGPGSLSMVFPIDLVCVHVDDVDDIFVAHCVARRGWWAGPILTIMNAQFIGAWDVAPRSHPNDGWADLLEVTMTFTERLQARRRLHSGTHVPHPGIVQRRITSEVFRFARPRDVWLDGERIARVRNLRVEVIPDALAIVL